MTALSGVSGAAALHVRNLIGAHSEAIRVLAGVGDVAVRAAHTVGEPSEGYAPAYGAAELVALMTAEERIDLADCAAIATLASRMTQLLTDAAMQEHAAAQVLHGAAAAQALQHAEISRQASERTAEAARVLERAADGVAAALCHKFRALSALSNTALDGVAVRDLSAIVEHLSDNKLLSSLLELGLVQDGVSRWVRERLLPFAEEIERRIVAECVSCDETVTAEFIRAATAIGAITAINTSVEVVSEPAPQLLAEAIPEPVTPAPNQGTETTLLWEEPSAPREESSGALLHRSSDFGLHRERTS
ncbi:hypothetical protein [Hoyosella altamirensis]|uniref:Uncharacterized protein n=1 Tax=Hoyosella altamirensis TaxID=616997 RepID=A0A839RSV4_9ACTN|nr:hypothetical protein [Hoyosella altamirensis]MBB3039650.1 hypothetical protein [Hoyosella altamirensis]